MKASAAPPSRAATWVTLGVLVPILLAAAAIRLYGLGSTDLFGDEAFSVMLSLGPISQIVGKLSLNEPHPPLYPFLLAGWLRAAGASELAARLPSAFAGIASVAVAAGLGREFAPAGDRWRAIAGAALAGLLVAVNPFQVWYSQEARMYAQVSLFAGLATLCLLRLWRGRPGSGLWYALAVVGTAGSHYYGLFVPLAHGLALLATSWRDRAFIGRWVRAIALAALLYLPWVVIALPVFTSYYGGPPGSENLPQVALSAWVRLTAGWSLTWGEAVARAEVVSALALIGLLLPARATADRFLRTVLFSWLATPFVAGYVISLWRPLYNERYLIVASLPLILLVARGATWLLTPAGPVRLTASPTGVSPAVRGLLGLGALGVAVGVAWAPLHHVWLGEYVQSAYDTEVKIADQLARPADVVILNGPTQEPLYQYYARMPLPYLTMPRRVPIDPVASAGALARFTQGHTGAWVFWYATPLTDPDNVVARWLAAHAYRSIDTYAASTRLQYYRLVPDGALTARVTDLAFGQALALRRYAWLAQPLAAGDTIPVDLTWQALGSGLPSPRVALRLVDANGFTWAQIDEDIGSGYLAAGAWQDGHSVDDRHGLLVPRGTPPGDYRLLLNVYSAQHPQSLPATGQGAPVGPGGVELARVTVSQASADLWPAGIPGYQAVVPTASAAFAGEGLRLLGDVASGAARAGDSGYLSLWWQAARDAPSGSQLRLELLGGAGAVAEQRDLPLATSGYPVSRWQRGEVLREQYHLPISDRLAPGTYQLAVLPLTADRQAMGAPVILGALLVQPGLPPPAVSAPQHPLNDRFGPGIALQGFDLATSQVRAGQTVDLTLHWGDLSPVGDDYTVFVHVLSPAEKVMAQRDQPPDGGQRPTSSWFPGDQILDRYQLALPSTLPPGQYQIEVGLYNPSNGVRLPVSAGAVPAGDRVILAQLQVTAAGGPG